MYSKYGYIEIGSLRVCRGKRRAQRQRGGHAELRRELRCVVSLRDARERSSRRSLLECGGLQLLQLLLERRHGGEAREAGQVQVREPAPTSARHELRADARVEAREASEARQRAEARERAEQVATTHATHVHVHARRHGRGHSGQREALRRGQQQRGRALRIRG